MHYSELSKYPVEVAEVSLCYNIDPLVKIEKRRYEQLQAMKKIVRIKNITTQETIRVEQNYHGIVGKDYQNI